MIVQIKRSWWTWKSAQTLFLERWIVPLGKGNGDSRLNHGPPARRFVKPLRFRYEYSWVRIDIRVLVCRAQADIRASNNSFKNTNSFVLRKCNKLLVDSKFEVINHLISLEPSQAVWMNLKDTNIIQHREHHLSSMFELPVVIYNNSTLLGSRWQLTVKNFFISWYDNYIESFADTQAMSQNPPHRHAPQINPLQVEPPQKITNEGETQIAVESDEWPWPSLLSYLTYRYVPLMCWGLAVITLS